MRFRLLSSGIVIACAFFSFNADAQVGIGTTSPTGFLHVYGNSTGGTLPHLLLQQPSTGYTRLAFQNSSTNNLWTIGGLPASTNDAAKCTFYYDGLGGDVMVMTGDGKVGIGTNAPTNTLVVQGTAAPQLVIRQPESVTGGAAGLLINYDITGAPWQLRAALSANGPALRFGTGFGAPTVALLLYGSGDATLTGTLTQNSDARLKRDIKPLNGSLASLQQLTGYSYYWKSKDKSPAQQIGFTAQELQAVYPQLVRADHEGILSVNYTGLVPVLVEAVKEQQTQIATLQQENNDLKQQLDRIEHLLKSIKQDQPATTK